MANWMMDNLVPWFLIFATLVVIAASIIAFTTIFHVMLAGKCF